MTRTVMTLLGGVVGIAASGSVSATTYMTAADFTAAALSAMLIEDFESVPQAETDTGLSSLSRPNVSFAPITNDLYVASAGAPDFVVATTSKVLTADGNENFQGTLTDPAGSLGFDVVLNGLGPVTIGFYNGATLLDTIVFATGSGYAYAGMVSDTAITRFTFTATNGQRFDTGIDNLRAGPVAASPAPEPTAWALMILGFGLLGGALRRARQGADRSAWASAR